MCRLDVQDFLDRQSSLPKVNLDEIEENEADEFEEIESGRLAGKALLYLAHAINDDLTYVLGYLLIDSLTADQRAELLVQNIQMCASRKSTVLVLTCDGDPSNLAMAEKLGAKIRCEKKEDLSTFNLDNLMTVPGVDHKVSFNLDICHDKKNDRTAIAKKGEFDQHRPLTEFFSPPTLQYILGNYYDSNWMQNEKKMKKRTIAWSYIVKLNDIQKAADGLRLANRLRQSHIDFHKNKMNVALAAQTLSRKTAQSILHCDRGLNLPKFKDSLHTVVYISVSDILFDILDSRSVSAFNFKRAVDEENVETVFAILDEIVNYLKDLSYNGSPLLKSRRHTAYTGYLTNIATLKRMYELLVVNKVTDCVKMHKFCQDVIEKFFGACRRSLGNNNNPNAAQFDAYIRRVLSTNRINFVNKGNCELGQNDSIKILDD